ncbi:H+-ATPase subunit E/Vma4 [Brevinema andersonii]|uniref:H+-ATPase subunit E/Vma4 n=1 Tax=Brevinema andersonii TaxID=34097 RepID=A0A1I1DWJ0_BREAD|nr:hypothetical protein [Brevinema andersonii]SFB77070.1 H+-ATPase subunit E/Vma4 [Brevinema andersonii]
MALKDMISDIEQTVIDEINQSRDHAKIEATKKVLAKGDILEDFYNNKKDILRSQLSKKEISLKSEKDFLYRNKQLKEEDEFINNLLPLIRSSLLTFVLNKNRYGEILRLCLVKISDSTDLNNSYLYINSRDIELIHDNVSLISGTITIAADDTIEAGFIIKTRDGVNINLSFAYLFEEQKAKLLNSTLRMLKEGL